jgi:hypothetical protein
MWLCRSSSCGISTSKALSMPPHPCPDAAPTHPALPRRRAIIAAIFTVPMAILAMTSMVPAAKAIEMGQGAKLMAGLPWSWLVQGALSGVVQVRGLMRSALAALSSAGDVGACAACVLCHFMVQHCHMNF